MSRSDRRVMVRTSATHRPPSPQDTPCRLSQGSLSGAGYGRKWVDGRMVLMHRWVMEQVYGPLDGVTVRHKCDNPPCFRFDHLVRGTMANNSRDMMDRGRGRSQFHSDHPTVMARRKLTDAGKQAIRDGYTGAWGEQSRIAERHGLNRATVTRILKGQR